ncbi:MAG: putative transcriptional regulatory protein [Candidatus Xenobia bacterium]|jgi:YebC/PmpR family DNA-binding regulatory protein
MAGHSKWHNIRIRKGKQDAVKGKAFTKVSREILMAARSGSSDPEANFRLKMAIAKAREVNMPMSNVERIIEKATGGGDSSMEELIYEGYGPAGVALIVEVTTDNRNRTAADMRVIFSKNGGNLGETGCVGWMFDKRGVITVHRGKLEEEQVLEIAMEGGALDMVAEDERFEILTEPTDLHQVKEALEKAGLKVESAGFSMVPRNGVEVSREDAPAVLKLVDLLEDQDDVQQVYANFLIPDEVLEELASA